MGQINKQTLKRSLNILMNNLMMKQKKVFLTRTLHDFALKELGKYYQIEVHSGKIPIPRKKLESKIQKFIKISQGSWMTTLFSKDLFLIKATRSLNPYIK